MSGRPSAAAVDLLVAHHRQFLAFLEKRTGSREDAEEVLQSAFVKTLQKGDAIRDDESVVAWFYRVLRRAVVDHWRHRDMERRALEREARGLAEAGDVPEPALEAAICTCVAGLVPLLKPSQAELIERVDLRGEEIGAVGRALGLTAGNARVRLHRARAALRREVGRSCGACAEHGCLDCSCSRPPAGPAAS